MKCYEERTHFIDLKSFRQERAVSVDTFYIQSAQYFLLNLVHIPESNFVPLTHRLKVSLFH